MSNERKHHTPEEKVTILRRHLVDLSWFSLKWRVAVLSKLEFRRFAAGVFKA